MVTTFEYGISTRNADQLTFTRITASQIIAMLDSSIPLQNAHIQAVKDLVREGCHYCNEDSDVLSAALTIVRTKRTEMHEWEAGWVARMNREAAAEV